MSEELYFNNELRNCLDAAVYSDCGENDQWNYWYQRLRKAHDAAVDRVTETQRAENAKLREQIFWLKQGDILHVLTDQEYIDQCERERLMQVSIDALDKENAKLRELVRDMHACISHANEQDWFYFERDKFGCGMSCTVNGEACGLCALADRMSELGVEP